MKWTLLIRNATRVHCDDPQRRRFGASTYNTSLAGHRTGGISWKPGVLVDISSQSTSMQLEDSVSLTGNPANGCAPED